MKLRAATKHFMDRKPNGGIVIKATHCIECLHKRRWQLLGDDNGILKFDTREARDAHLAALNADIANARGQRPPASGGTSEPHGSAGGDA